MNHYKPGDLVDYKEDRWMIGDFIDRCSNIEKKVKNDPVAQQALEDLVKEIFQWEYAYQKELRKEDIDLADILEQWGWYVPEQKDGKIAELIYSELYEIFIFHFMTTMKSYEDLRDLFHPMTKNSFVDRLENEPRLRTYLKNCLTEIGEYSIGSDVKEAANCLMTSFIPIPWKREVATWYLEVIGKRISEKLLFQISLNEERCNDTELLARFSAEYKVQAFTLFDRIRV